MTATRHSREGGSRELEAAGIERSIPSGAWSATRYRLLQGFAPVDGRRQPSPLASLARARARDGGAPRPARYHPGGSSPPAIRIALVEPARGWRPPLNVRPASSRAPRRARAPVRPAPALGSPQAASPPA